MREEEAMIIRPARVSDAPALLAIYAPYVEATAISFEYEVPSTEEFARRIEETLKKYPYLVAEEEGRLLGYTYAAPFKERAAYQWAVETTIYLDLGEKRKGIGRQLYAALEAELRKMNVLSACACIAYIEREDAYLTHASMRFHAKVGYDLVAHFHRCGYKFDRWYDMIWMEKRLDKHAEKPLPFLPYSEIRQM